MAGDYTRQGSKETTKTNHIDRSNYMIAAVGGNLKKSDFQCEKFSRKPLFPAVFEKETFPTREISLFGKHFPCSI